MATLSETLALAIEHHRAGRLQAAAQLYEQILQADPSHADAWHLRGLAAYQAAQHTVAVDHIRRAIELKPNVALFHSNLGAVYGALKKRDQALACFQRALAINPNNAEVYHNLGNVYKEQKKWDEAVDCYRQAVKLKPDNAEVRFHLGNLLNDQGKVDEAIAFYRQALVLKPDHAEAHSNLGLALQNQGKLDEAVACFHRALELKPNVALFHSNLGGVYGALKKLDEAVACFHRALELKPDYAEAHNNLGLALQNQGKLDDAIASHLRSLELKRDYAEAHNNLGLAFIEQGMTDQAVTCFHRALQIKPGYAEGHNNLGNVFCIQGRIDEATACYREALRLQPTFARAHSNLGLVLRLKGLLDEAISSCQEALRLEPDCAEAHNNLGLALQNQGKLDEAMACLHRALQIKPQEAVFQSNVLGTLHYHSRYDARAICEELRRWEREQVQVAVASHFANEPSPERRLRIGYVSPDFSSHVVGRNVWPLLRNHDHDKFEITLYANVTRADLMTEQFHRCADHWCPIVNWPDARVADRIRKDGIDLLVDLALHTAGNRLLVFARKPAPVQVTFAGYPGTTGLHAIDYRLTDPYLDPPGLNDQWYAEESYRLPHCFWCYDPQIEEPAVGPLPALQRGFVTFGCLNNFCKVNEQVLELWARVLRAVQGSRLLLLSKQGSHRQRTLDILAQRGIAAERVEFASPRPRPEYLALYNELDIGLDTFPYNGHTTSLDSYWMGVPVITLVGQTVVGRAGLSQLTNLGLTELVATTPERFVALAVALAGDLPRLAAMRSGLRERMRQSPLMDAAGFARGIEEAYRTMWRKWCGQQQR